MSIRRSYDHRIREAVVLFWLLFIRVSGTHQFELRRLPDGTKKLGLLAAIEVTIIGDMVASSDNRHMSIRALTLYARRIGHVFAHPLTRGRLIRDRGWRRPRLCVYPARPKIGVKVTKPNEIWQIDNFSRRIPGWCVEERLNPMNPFRVLSEASNGLRRFVEFYVQQHNEVMPHSAFNGETPDEICFGRAPHPVERLTAHRIEARSKRLIANRLSSCPKCLMGPSIAKTKLPTLDLALSQKQPKESSLH